MVLALLVSAVAPRLAGDPVRVERTQRGLGEVECVELVARFVLLVGEVQVRKGLRLIRRLLVLAGKLRGSTDLVLKESLPRILLDDPINMPRELCFEPINVNVRGSSSRTQIFEDGLLAVCIPL